MAAKKILFVTYGGGHATMVAPVVRALAENYPDIATETLALTLGGPYFKRQGLPYYGYQDFLLPEDAPALAWGKQLAEAHHHPETGIEESEAIAYLGLSYWELIQTHGEEHAAQLWQTQGRNAFLPRAMLARIIDRVQPDMVVTTNSPRSEQAAVEIANRRGIPTLSMQDLFGLFNFCQPQADYVAVISDVVRDNILRDQGLRAGQTYLMTGNPAFDAAFDYRGPINHAWRREHFPTLPEHAKTLLWLDDNAYIHKETGAVQIRTAEEIITDLNDLAAATAQNNGYLLIRPHPSQQRAVFDQWIAESGHARVLFAGGVPLYPLLNASDAIATYTSTVGCEALLMDRPVIQLDYYPGTKNLLLGEWGVARLAKTPADLPELVRQSFHEPASADMQARINAMFPNERAAPKMAAAIHHILFT